MAPLFTRHPGTVESDAVRDGTGKRQVLLPSSLLVTKKTKSPPRVSVGSGSLKADTDLVVNLMQI